MTEAELKVKEKYSAAYVATKISRFVVTYCIRADRKPMSSWMSSSNAAWADAARRLGHPMSDLEQRIKEAAEKFIDWPWKWWADKDTANGFMELCSPLNIKALLAEKDAALESLKAELALWRSEHDPCPFSIELEALKARAMQAEKERDDYEFASAEWSTVANWRSAQVNSAKAAGIEFTEPGITCKNVRAGQWEKIATDYRNYHGDAPRSCSLFNSGDKRCDSCKAYDALSGPREGEQDGKAD